MYDPTVGRFLQEDPIEIAGGDPNFYRYCGNDPANGTDPTGLADIRRVKTVNGPFDVNPALAKSNLFGTKWQWEWNPVDAWSIAQRVTVNGVFSVKVCGKSGSSQEGGFKASDYEVQWREEYIEVWTQRGTTEENHLARPAKPAQYLEEQAGWKLSSRPDGLFVVSKGQRKAEVLEWHFAMTGKFEVVNGFYPRWTAALGGFYTSRNNFRVTGLVVDGQQRQPVVSREFDHMLYPGFEKPEVPGFPPPRTLGMRLECNENWVLNWQKGQHAPKSDYSPPTYELPAP